jgi:hypothetical protein
MKSKEEIEQLAKDFADDAHGSPTATFLEKGYIKGYTQLAALRSVLPFAKLTTKVLL